jgi:hypothetical protein
MFLQGIRLLIVSTGREPPGDGVDDSDESSYGI